MIEFFIMLFTVAWGIIITILYIINTSFQNRKISEIDKKINALTLKCKSHGERTEAEKTERPEGTET